MLLDEKQRRSIVDLLPDGVCLYTTLSSVKAQWPNKQSCPVTISGVGPDVIDIETIYADNKPVEIVVCLGINTYEGVRKMQSDCGNRIVSIKFNVYLHDDGHGFFRVAAEQGTMPKTIRESYEFTDGKDMAKQMESVRKEIRRAENTIKYVCKSCNLGIRNFKELSHTSCITVQDNIGKVMCCPRCDSTDIVKV